MSLKSLAVREVLTISPVIPVIVIEDVNHAVPLARALVEGGLKVLEVTLRTPVGLAAITAIRNAVPEAIVGAGTLLSVEQMQHAVQAGSQFLVSPGFSRRLVLGAQELNVPMLPGCVTATEIMAALDCGLDTLKFFPASRSGGTALLKDFASVFSPVRFCPTGGIDLTNAGEYLGLPNVLCVGMSSVAPTSLMLAGDFDGIRERARQAAALPSR